MTRPALFVLILAGLLLPDRLLAQGTAGAVRGGSQGFAVESADGEFRLQLAGLVHADARFAPGDREEAITDTFALRRVRFSLRGRLTPRLEFHLNPDFGGGTLVLQDAYVDTVVSSALRIRVGKAKAPFGLERGHAAGSLLFFNRALPTSLVPNRDVGIQFLGDLAGGVVSYAAGVMNGVADGGSADVDTSDDKDVVGRVMVRPFRRRTAHPLRGLGLGLAVSRGRQTGPGALTPLRTATLDRTYFSYAGASADGVRTRYSPHATYHHGPFSGFLEYVESRIAVRTETGGRDELAHDAWQVAVSYVVTGEDATDTGGGIRPRGAAGAVQLAARYHVLRVDPRAFTLAAAAPDSRRTAAAWTVDLNWYLTDNLRYTANVERTVFDDDAGGPRRAESAVVFRTQVNF